MSGEPVDGRSERAPIGSVAWCLGAAGLLGLVTFTFAAVTGFGFVSWDDPGYILKNQTVQEGLNWSGVRWAFTHTHMANWHPLTWLSHMLDVELFGGGADAAGGHHLTSAVIHGLNALLLFVALARLTGSAGRAFVVAALFAVHPLRAESVAWVSERKDVLSGFFFMLTLIAWQAHAVRPGARRLALVALALALGLLSKPMLVTLPCLLLLLDAWPLGRWQAGPLPAAPERAPTRSAGALLLEKLPLFALVLAAVLATWFAQAEAGALRGLSALPLGERLAAAPVAVWSYVGKLLWPTGLVFHYPLQQGGASPVAALAASLGLAAVTLAVLFGRGRSRPYLALGWLWFVGMLVPVIGLVQVGGQSIADRYTYLPSIGLTLALVFGVSDWLESLRLPRWVGPALAAVLIASAAALARPQVKVWRSSFRLYTHAMSQPDVSYLAHHNLGQVLVKRGQFDEARAHFAASLQREPGYARSHSSLAELLVQLDEWDAATASFERALELAPDEFVALYGLAQLHGREERWEQAVALAERACEQRPKSLEARMLLGMSCLERGDPAVAIAAFKWVLERDPGHALARQQLGIAREARRQSRQ
jgi:tetratricopeptide (TPR) repeat protein